MKARLGSLAWLLLSVVAPLCGAWIVAMLAAEWLRRAMYVAIALDAERRAREGGDAK